MADIDLYLVAGQSNAEGRGDSLLSPIVDPDYGYEYNGASVLALADPVGGATSGSAWPAFANALLAVNLHPLCITEAAVGGTALLAESDSDNWAPGSTNYTAAVTRANDAIAELEADGWTPTLRGILWHQGETDALTYPSPSTLQVVYMSALINLHDRFKADLGSVPMFVFRLGRPDSADTAGFQAVRAAQEVACSTRTDMHMVYRGAVDFPANDMMTDELHYNQDGYNLMGSIGGAAAAQILFGATATFRIDGEDREGVARLDGVNRSIAELRTIA